MNPLRPKYDGLFPLTLTNQEKKLWRAINFYHFCKKFAEKFIFEVMVSNFLRLPLQTIDWVSKGRKTYY